MALAFTISDQASLTDFLKQYNYFGECILIDYWPERFSLDVVLLIQNIWGGHGNIREDLDAPDLFTFYCRNCTKAILERKILPVIRAQEVTPWGTGEFVELDYCVNPAAPEELILKVIWGKDEHFSYSCESIQIERVDVSADIRHRIPWRSRL